MRLFGLILAGALVFLTPGPAAADWFEIVSVGLGTVGGPSFLTPFDHTLGTLTSVDVSIIGGVSATILTQVDLGTGPIPTPSALDWIKTSRESAVSSASSNRAASSFW